MRGQERLVDKSLGTKGALLEVPEVGPLEYAFLLGRQHLPSLLVLLPQCFNFFLKSIGEGGCLLLLLDHLRPLLLLGGQLVCQLLLTVDQVLYDQLGQSENLDQD